MDEDIKSQLEAVKLELARITHDRDAKTARMWQLGRECEAAEAREAKLREIINNAARILAEDAGRSCPWCHHALVVLLSAPVLGCWCHKCNEHTANPAFPGLPYSSSHMILCPDCGNKRCPRASDHRLKCTNSNESGQPGSVYE